MSPSFSAASNTTKTSLPGSRQDSSKQDFVTIMLPDRLDFAAARNLHAELVQLRGETVVIDGTTVVFAGALAAQVMMSAVRDWKVAGDALALKTSAVMRGDLERLGVLTEFPNLVEVATC
jgi:anti-anti-sigma regulatory factor